MAIGGEALRIGHKAPVRSATTAPIVAISGGAPNVLDGVSLAVYDRVLVKDQGNPAQNGLYYVTALGTGSNGVWQRARDADAARNLLPGTQLRVVEGTVNAGKNFALNTPGPIVVGTTPLTFQEIAAGVTMLDDATPLGIFGAIDFTGNVTITDNGGGEVGVDVGGADLAVLRDVTTVEANTASITVAGRGIVTSLGAGAVQIDVSDEPWHRGTFLANAATDADHPLTGLADVDGVPLIEDVSRVLVRAQTAPAENGVYIPNGIAWVRDPYFDANGNPQGEPYVYAGSRVYVAGGAVFANASFFVSNTFAAAGADARTMTPDFGVDDIVFVQLTGGGGSGMPSDTDETEIKATGAFTTSPAATSAIEVLDFREIDVAIEVTNKTGITEFALRAEFSTQASPATWQPVVSDDDILAGASAPSQVVYTFGTAPAVTFREGATFPVKGRWMRFLVSADAAGGAYSVAAYRRG